jgi:hypothetical protein
MIFTRCHRNNHVSGNRHYCRCYCLESLRGLVVENSPYSCSNFHAKVFLTNEIDLFFIYFRKKHYIYIFDKPIAYFLISKGN